jgi:peptidoglycan/xylan/chitin deacetylase (PgdA/CDA1 family)
MNRGVVAMALLAGCHMDDRLSYAWDDRRVLCSEAVDDMTQTLNWGRVEDQIAQAEREKWATLMHAHKPGETISMDAIDRIFTTADDHQLDYVRFSELVPGEPRAGLALAFDDDDVAGWFSLRDTFTAHGAHLTFFVTRWHELTPDELAMLDMLVADGHELQPHSFDHVNAIDYVEAHGIDGYLTDEVLPSIQVMIDAGFHPTAFAFPFGASAPAIDDAVLRHIDKVRVSPGSCPY